MESSGSALNGSTYKGSYVFSSVAASTGLPIDQFNFLLSELLALILAVGFRRLLPPKASNTLTRHLVGRTLSVLVRRDDSTPIHSSQCSRYRSQLLLFRSRNLASVRAIVRRLSDARSPASDVLAHSHIRLLHDLHERQ
jgi:hypothetical protein